MRRVRARFARRTRFVLWGARAGDCQIGSSRDRLYCIVARALAMGLRITSTGRVATQRQHSDHLHSSPVSGYPVEATS